MEVVEEDEDAGTDCREAELELGLEGVVVGLVE